MQNVQCTAFALFTWAISLQVGGIWHKHLTFLGHATRRIVAQFPKYLLIKCVVEKCRNTKVFCASPIFMSHKHHIITHIYCTIGSLLAHFGRPSAAFWQSVSSRRGPIYRARIYENTHEMADGYVRVVKWIYIFNNVKTHIRWFENTYLIMWKYVFSYGNTRF